MDTLSHQANKGFGQQGQSGGTTKIKRGKLWFWGDPEIRKIFLKFCEEERIKKCEAIEEAMVIYMQQYKTVRTDLELQVTLQKGLSQQERHELKNEIISEIHGKKKQGEDREFESPVIVSCRCSYLVVEREALDKAGYVNRMCPKCDNKFRKADLKLLKNTPHFFCPNHPHGLTMAYVDEPPVCKECGRIMTLIWQPPAQIEEKKKPEKKRYPHRFDNLQKTLI